MGPRGLWRLHAILVAGRDLDEVRAWRSGDCTGDFLILLGRRIVSDRREGATVAVVVYC